MLNIHGILSGLGTLNKIVPVIEAVEKEIGPLVRTELKDGQALWDDVHIAFEDLKNAVAAVKAAAEIPPKD